MASRTRETKSTETTDVQPVDETVQPDAAAAATPADDAQTDDGSTVDAAAQTEPADAGTDEAVRQTAAAAETDAQPPVRTGVYGGTETVQPKRYAEPGWAVGRNAPKSVVRVYDERGVLGEPRDGELKPGERGVLVVQSGQQITRAVRAALTV